MYKDDFHNRLKTAVLASGKKQKEIAASTGIKETTLSTYVTGTSEPNIENLGRIAKELNRTTDSLIYGEEDVPMSREGDFIYEQNRMKLSLDEVSMLTWFRDMPEQDQKEILKTIHLTWAEAKGVL